MTEPQGKPSDSSPRDLEVKSILNWGVRALMAGLFFPINLFFALVILSNAWSGGRIFKWLMVIELCFVLLAAVVSALICAYKCARFIIISTYNEAVGRDGSDVPGNVLLALLLAAIGFGGTIAGGVIFAMGTMGGHGRPLRRGRKRLFADLDKGSDWIRKDLKPDVSRIEPEVKQKLAAAWLEDARAEHSSVVTFARLSEELMKYGVPPGLIAECHLAALDEIRHAQIAFSLAAAYSGETVSPGPFTEAFEAPTRNFGRDRERNMIRLAQESLIEGCLGEGFSAKVLAEGARLAADPVLAKALTSMAEDEARHAELAWDILRWCGDTLGERVTSTLPALLERAKPDFDTCPEPELEIHGRLSPDKLPGLFEETRHTYSARLEGVFPIFAVR